jgi:hypothetical protein
VTAASVRVVTLCTILLIAAVSRAAPPETVVVVTEDAGFARAVEDAFRAAGIRTVQAAPDAPPAIADLSSGSRRIADREHATAAVALVSGEDGATLIAYDRSVDRALVRVLPYRMPLDPRQSAEAAHMARTMLRALRVTPEVDLPPPHPEDAIAIRARTAAAQLASSAATPEAPAAGGVAASLIGGLRIAAPGAAVGASGAIQLIWRPDALGVSLTASLARAAAVDAAPFTGTASDAALALTARLPVRLAPRWQLTGELGAAVHRVRLAGASSGTPVEAARLDPAIRAGGAAMFAASARISAGLAVWADGLLVRQDYRFVTQRVLDVPPIQVTVGAILIARIL